MSARRRILFLDEVSLVAGGAHSLLLLLERIDRTRFEPLLACPEGPLAERARWMGIPIVAYDFPQRRMFQSCGPWLVPNPLALVARSRDGAKLADLVRDLQVDLIHTNSTAGHLGGLLAARRARVPIVWHVRYRTSRWLYRLPAPDATIFLSERFRDWALEGLRPRTSVVIPNGIDARAFARGARGAADLRRNLNATGHDVIVTTVARLKPLKGHATLMEAFARLRRCTAGRVDVGLWLIGEEMTEDGSGYAAGGGRYRRVLERRAEELGVRDAVHFLGFREDVAALLRASDVFCLPSHTEASPRVVLEAMSLGVPVVGTRVGGVPEQVVEGTTGLVVSPRDDVGLAEALERLVLEKDLRAGMGRNGRERVRRVFGADAVARRVESVWEELLTFDPARRNAGRNATCVSAN